MLCWKCKKEEATTFRDCLIVGRSVTRTNLITTTQKETKEFGKGIRKIGLCEKCLKKQCKQNKNSERTIRFFLLPLIIFFAGLAIGAAIQKDNSTASFVIIGISFAILAGTLIFSEIVDRVKINKDPTKAFCGAGIDIAKFVNEDNLEIPVPVGEGLYKDFKQFKRCNQYLSDGAAKKIYDEIIVPGKWKDMTTDTGTGSEKTDSTRITAMAAALALEQLYRKTPQGFLSTSPQAEPVRKIGRELNEAGGMQLMLEAHGYFSAMADAIGPGLPRNLESVWDGIGEWRG